MKGFALCLLLMLATLHIILATPLSIVPREEGTGTSRWYIESDHKGSDKSNEVAPEHFANREEFKHHAYEEDSSLVSLPFDKLWLKFSYWKDKYRKPNNPHKQGGEKVDHDAFAY